MSELDELLDRLEELVDAVEHLEQPVRDQVFELLDGVDSLHRWALRRLAAGLDDDQLRRLRAEEPAVAWLFEAYDITVPDPAEPTPVQLGPTRRRG